MAVRKIRKSWWVDFRHNGVRYRKKSPENSRIGALSYEALLRRKLARGESVEVKEKEQLFKNFAWQWFDVYVKNNNKMSEINGKKCVLNTHLIPFFGKFPISAIPNLKIEQYKAKKINEGLSNKTINNHLTIFGKCLRTAQEWLEFEKLPKIKKLKVPPHQFDYLTQEEAQKLLNNACDLWFGMILVALKTGLRLGELRGLKWEDIDWQNGTLTVKRAVYRFHIVPPKSNRERTIPLIKEVWDLLYKKKHKNGYVFTIRDGEPMRNTNCRYKLYKVCDLAGLRRIGWHVLRHTFASHLVQAGASVKAIQELLGHTDIRTTMRYAHMSPSILQDTVDLLSENKNYGQHMVNAGQKFKNIVGSIAADNSEILFNVKEKQDSKAL
jgi:integrase